MDRGAIYGNWRAQVANNKDTEKSKLCEYGCDQEAKYQLKNGKWCCNKSYNMCPISRKKNSESNKGKKISQETKNKIQESNLGKKRTYETRKKISESKKGKTLSNEVKQNLSIMRKGKRIGKDNPFYGKKHNTNTKLKMSSAHKGQLPWNTGKKGKNSPTWKGGYSSKNLPLYDTYYNQLSFAETCKRNSKDKNILDVKCSTCGIFFTPTLNSITNRIAALNGIQGGEHKLYCSENCKKQCSVYGKKIYQENHPIKEKEIYNYSEYQIFKQYVLERDGHKCQYCGEKAEHVHHERPQKIEPFFALDPDLAWSVCKKCHYEKGHVKGSKCSTGAIANKIC